MTKITPFLFIALLAANCVFAQSNTPDQPCPCCSENYKAFDFWVGDWNVFNSKGEIVGTNRVVKMQDGCLIQENWQASNNKNSGTSYNYFNLKDSTWNQVWISNSGNVLNLKGNLDKNGAMVLKSDLVNGAKGKYYNQITWSKNDDGSVTQSWDILNEQNEKISKAFVGIYRKKTNSSKSTDPKNR